MGAQRGPRCEGSDKPHKGAYVRSGVESGGVVYRFPVGVCPACGAQHATDMRGIIRGHTDKRSKT